MASNLTRLSTADAYSSALTRLSDRQQALTRLQENLTAGKRVVRASDDPTAAAQAERARTRMARIDTDSRALAVQRNAMATAESSLGTAGTLMQNFRELLVQAGNTTLTDTDRASIAQRLQSTRDQIFALANTKDSNGQPLFGGLGSADAPFVDTAGGVTYDAIPGQTASGGSSVPATLDGYATWMNVPRGNGVFTVAQAAATTGVWSDQGQVTNPAAVTGHNYSIQFTVNTSTTPATTTYSVTDTTSATTVLAAQPYSAGKAIAFDGLSIVPNGTPANGESLTVAPAGRDSVFGTLDRAIASVKGSAATGTMAHNVAGALTEVDSAMARLQSSRGLAGDLLNRVDNIADGQSAMSLQLEADRSRAEDLDMTKGISDFGIQQTAYSAALQSYAQIQKLSLFNFLS